MSIDQTGEIERQLIAWAAQQDSVRAVLLTNSRANPNEPVDVLSDYDVILVVQDIHPFFDDSVWLQHFGDVLVVSWDSPNAGHGNGIEQVANVTQYTNGLKIDFTLWTVEFLHRIAEGTTLPADLDAGYTILLDKDHLTDRMQVPTYTAFIPIPPTNEVFQSLVERFFGDAPYVAKCLSRDDLLPAKWRLDYDMKHNFLRQMLEWRMEQDYQWSLPTGALGKGLKQRLPSDIWFQLERTYVGAGIEENWDALFKTMTLFCQAAIVVADHLGYTYPLELDQQIMSYVRNLKKRSENEA